MGVGFPWISLDFLVRIVTYQWVTRLLAGRIFLASFSGEDAPEGSLWHAEAQECSWGELNFVSDFLQEIVVRAVPFRPRQSKSSSLSSDDQDAFCPPALSDAGHRAGGVRNDVSAARFDQPSRGVAQAPVELDEVAGSLGHSPAQARIAVSSRQSDGGSFHPSNGWRKGRPAIGARSRRSRRRGAASGSESSMSNESCIDAPAVY
jgi:hypothetical protein